MPATCQTLGVTPLVREMVVHLAALSPRTALRPATAGWPMCWSNSWRGWNRNRCTCPARPPAPARDRRPLAARPDDRATLADWGRRVAMSERTLARLVRQEVGMSFGRWRQRLHIILALQWLSEGLSVQRSADQLGYESVSAFITCSARRWAPRPPATSPRRR